MSHRRSGPGPDVRSRGWVPLLGWFASLGAGIVVFVLLGQGALAAPALSEPGTWGAWADARGPVVAVAAILRLLVLALAWYLVGVTTIGLVARLTRAARLVRIADALSVPVVRRMLQATMGVTLAASVVAASAGAGRLGADSVWAAPPGAAAVSPMVTDLIGSARADRGDDVPGMVRDAATKVVVPTGTLGPPGASPLPRGDESDVVTWSSPPDGAPQDEASPPEVALPDESSPEADLHTGPAPAVPADVLVADSAFHEVVAGDHLWGIARATVARDGGVEPSDRAVAAYWQRLIAANRDVLVDPDNPDLILPGQRFRLPAANGEASGASGGDAAW